MSLLFGAFILSGVAYAQAPAAPAVPAAPAAEAAKSAAHHERHPELNKAIRKLKAAKEDLEKAAKDFGGHKAKAVAAIDQALEELKEAKEFDKK